MWTRFFFFFFSLEPFNWEISKNHTRAVAGIFSSSIFFFFFKGNLIKAYIFHIWEQLARLLLFGLRSSLFSHIIFLFTFSLFNLYFIFILWKKKNLFNDLDWDLLFFSFTLNLNRQPTIEWYRHQLQYPLSQLGVIADLVSQYFYLTSWCLSIVLDCYLETSAWWCQQADVVVRT